MALAATLYSNDQDTRRRSARRDVGRESTLRDPTLRPVEALVHDLSVDGLRVAASIDLPLESVVWIGLPGVGRVEARVVRRDGNTYGCAFLSPISPMALTSAFSGEAVIPFGSATEAWPVSDVTAEPYVERWPAPVRLGVVVGASALLWTLLIRAF